MPIRKHFSLGMVLLSLSILFAEASKAADLPLVSLARGGAYDKINIYKIGYLVPFSHTWFASSAGSFSGNWELTLGYWDWKKEHNYTAAISPVFNYIFGPAFFGVNFFFDAGIGTAYISEEHFERRDLSTHFQFEDQLGFGLLWGMKHQIKLNFRYLHYSNFGMKEPNQGIDISLIALSYLI